MSIQTHPSSDELGEHALTVAGACALYVADRRAERGEACAHDAHKRFERTVYGTSFGATRVRELRTPAIKGWRDGLKLSHSSRNRTLTALRAALNLAVRSRLIAAETAREWQDVKPYRHAGQRRELFLDLAQRRALLKAAGGAVRDLMEATMLTGARAGELVNATAAQFNVHMQTMRLTGKTGTRTVPLSAAAEALFARRMRSAPSAERLLVRDDGKPWAHSDWDQLVRAAAANAGLPRGVCLYTLRHSFITQALSDGMTTLEVARLVGTSLAMIDRHYGHLVNDALRERLARVVMR
jgi:site-specific recombinase XerD